MVKNFFGIVFLLWICLSCKANDKKAAETNAEVVTLQIDSATSDQTVTIFASNKIAENRRDSSYVEDFKKLFEAEANKWSVTFDYGTVEMNIDTLEIADNKNIKYSKYYKWTRKGIPSEYATISYYTFKDYYSSRQVVDNYCDAYYAAERKGEKDKFLEESPYSKVSTFVFHRYSTVFVIKSTKETKHILDKAIQEFRQDYKIKENEVIPCEREFIDSKLVAKIKPVLSDWLQFYNLDISHFYKTDTYSRRSIPVSEWEYEPDSASIHLREYDKKHHDVYNPILYDYSPNKKYYLNLLETSGVHQSEDGTWSYEGGDDCQEIYLTNRQDKWTDLHLWLGASAFAEGVFWIDNDSFIIAYRSYSDDSLTIDIYGKLSGVYSYRVKEFPKEDYFGYNLKKRGIKIYN